uniref:Uncharacterized protein n=1 Tax=Eubacterium plexicaudatum ASF492 TaxID=1235802 RepID=N1ZY89_9FIRM
MDDLSLNYKSDFNAIHDLEPAWNIEKNGVGDKNGFIKIRLGDNLPENTAWSCAIRRPRTTCGSAGSIGMEKECK